MRPITDASRLHEGDVLYHPAMGFARVTQRDEVGLHLCWEEPAARLPRRISPDAARKGYRLCEGEGFFARSVVDQAPLRRLLNHDPSEGLQLLLEDLDEAPEREEVKEWLQRRGLLRGDDFVPWWSRALSDEERFSFRGRRLHLKPGWAAHQELVDEDDTSPLPDLSGPRPWSTLPPLRGLEVINVGMELLGLLAQHHAEGRPVGLGPDSVFMGLDGLEIELRDRGGMPTDVHNAGRLLLQRMLGKDLPRTAPHKVLPHLQAMVHDLPPSAMPLLEELVSPVFELRPRSAMGPYIRWAQAAAHEGLRQIPARPGGHVEVGADTHVGLYKMRDTQVNQDAFAVELGEAPGDSHLLLVADGISTSDAGSGDQASRLAVDTLLGIWERRPGALFEHEGRVQEHLTEALREANRAVCEAALECAEGDLTHRIPMGTTLVGVALHGLVADLISLGDSRIYLVGPLGSCLLTPDQNLALEWLQGTRSRLQDGEMMGSALVGYLGHFDADDSPRLLEPFARRLRLMPGETLVLCSDGITDFARPTHAEFLALLTETVRKLPPREAARALVNEANAGGGGDNATVVVARLSQV